MVSPNQPLAGRQILVCVSASIAAYKSVQLIRTLVKLGAFVRVATTPSTSRFVGSATFSAVASEPVYDDLWDNRGSIAHTSLGRNNDIVIVMPATASIISKMSNGIADDIVSASLLCTSTSTPQIVVTAMHEEMYDNAATQENINSLLNRGIEFLGPDNGELAGGDSGRGRLVDPEKVVVRVLEISAELPEPSEKISDAEIETRSDPAKSKI